MGAAAVWLGLALCAAPKPALKFERWAEDERYLQVSYPGLTCGGKEGYVKQIDPDSVLVEGSRFGRPTPLADYGWEPTDTNAKNRLLYESGMLIPELDPCFGGGTTKVRNGKNCKGYIHSWFSWLNQTYVNNKEDSPICPAQGNPAGCTLDDVKQHITHLKYSPTGALNLREAESAKANTQIFDQLINLSPKQRTAASEPYVPFNNITNAMWGNHLHGNKTEARNEGNVDDIQFPFVGMMQMKHPVFDGKDTNNNRLFGAQQRIAVKRCPNSINGTCCLALEGDPDSRTELTSIPLSIQLKGSDRTEYRLRWKYSAVHTSFSRGVPDLHSYQADTLGKDIDWAYHMRLRRMQDIAAQSDDSWKYCSNSNCPLKCKEPTDQHSRIASYLEHFYVGLVGTEEQKALSQPRTFEAYDRKRIENLFCKTWNQPATVSGGHEGKLPSDIDPATQDSIRRCVDKKYAEVCSKMPGGHCGHGYSCNGDQEEVAHDGVSCFPRAEMFDKGSGVQYYAGKYDYLKSGTGDEWTKLNGGYADANGRDKDKPRLAPTDFKHNQFRNRVRGRPELVQWWNDRIYYSGNRGRPDRWVCAWPPTTTHFVCRYDGLLLTLEEAKADGSCRKPGETWDDSDWLRLSNGVWTEGKQPDNWNKGWCIDGRYSLFTKETPEPQPNAGKKKIQGKDLSSNQGYRHQCFSNYITGEERMLCKPVDWRCPWPPNAGQNKPYCMYTGTLVSADAPFPTGCVNLPSTSPLFYSTNWCMDAREHGCFWDTSTQHQTDGFWNCFDDLEYETDTREQYMNYGYKNRLHALDAGSNGLAGLDAEVRMSGREIFTYGHGLQMNEATQPTPNPNPDDSTECPPLYHCDSTTIRRMDKTFFDDMLPCRGGKGVERGCYNVKTTKYEWLIAAMHQSITHTSNLLYGAHAFTAYPARKLHPVNMMYQDLGKSYPKQNQHLWSSVDGFPQHQVHGPKHLIRKDRVFLWDIDQSFHYNTPDIDFDAPKFGYEGASSSNNENDYLGNFKSILHNDRVSNETPFEFLWNNNVWDTSSSAVKDLTRWGTSDGTSRTNMHTLGCWVDNPLQENWYSAGAFGHGGDEFIQDGNARMGSIDGVSGFARRACLGKNMRINDASGTQKGSKYLSYSARPASWPYNFGFLRSIETIPMTLNSGLAFGKSFYTHACGEGNQADWGVMGIPLKHGGTFPIYYQKMAVACNYNDLFAFKKEYMGRDLPAGGGRYRQDWLGFNREGNTGGTYDSPQLDGWTLGRKDTDYADSMYFFKIQGKDRIGKSDDYKFSGSYSRCCANTPVIGLDENRKEQGYDMCAKWSPNNWDYPYNMYRDKNSDSGTACRGGSYDENDDAHARRALKQGSMNFHTCSDLRNATHFSISSDLDVVEEWDMFVDVKQQSHTAPTNIDSDAKGSTEYQITCPISNTASHPLFPGCPGIVTEMTVTLPNTIIAGWTGNHAKLHTGAAYQEHEERFNVSSVHLRLVKMNSDSFDQAQADRSGQSTKYTQLHSNSDNCGGDLVARVNWGKALSDGLGFAAYKDGKTDGVVECIFDEAHDLLLYSHLKRQAACLSQPEGLAENVKKLTVKSNCQNPRLFAEWRKQGGTGLTWEGETLSNGREMPKHYERCDCKTFTADNGGVGLPASQKCACGHLARTSRIVLTPDHDETPFNDSKPYAPSWIVDPAESICEMGNVHDRSVRRGLNPRRVCPRTTIEKTYFWEHFSHQDGPNEWESKSKAESMFHMDDLNVTFVTKPNWSRFELDRMEKCAAGDSRYCEDLTLDLGVVKPNTNDERYVLFRPTASQCSFDQSGQFTVDRAYLTMQSELQFTLPSLPYDDVCVFVRSTPEGLDDTLAAMKDMFNQHPDYWTIDGTTADNTMTEQNAFILQATLMGYQDILKELTQTISVDMTPFETKTNARISRALLQGKCYDQDFTVNMTFNSDTGLWRSGILEPKCAQDFKFYVLAGVGDTEQYNSDFNRLYAANTCKYPETLRVPNWKGPLLPQKARVSQGACTTDGLEIDSVGDAYCYDVDGLSAFTGVLPNGLPNKEYSFVSTTYHLHRISLHEDDNFGVNYFMRWGECDWLARVKWWNVTGSVLYYRGSNTPNGLIDFPTDASPQQFEYRSTLDGEEDVRELCFQIPMFPFARSVSTATPGEIIGLEAGDCQRCTVGEPQAIINAIVYDDISGALEPIGTPFGTDSPPLCNWGCMNTTNCTAFSYHQKTCTFYSSPPLFGKSTGVSVSVTKEQAIAYGHDIIVFCMSGEEGAILLNETVPTPVEPIPCPWNQAGTFPDCLTTPCDGTKERAIILNPNELGCTDRHHPECSRLCNPTGLLPQRTLKGYTPPRVDGFGSAADGDYSNLTMIKRTIPLGHEPYFYFTLAAVNSSSLGVLRARLPAIGPPCIELNETRQESLKGYLNLTASLSDCTSGGCVVLGNTTIEIPAEGRLKQNEMVTFEFVAARYDHLAGGQYRIDLRFEDPADDANQTMYLFGSEIQFCNPVEEIEEWFNLTESDSAADFQPSLPEILGRTSTFAVEVLKYCTLNKDDLHICVKHKACKPRTEYIIKPGTINSDTVCGRQPTCRFDELESSPPTPTSARVCTPHTVCTGPFKTKTGGTRENDTECMLRSPCGSDEFASASLYAAEGGCTKVQVCSALETPQRQAREPGMFSDSICETYKVECKATQYETAAQTATAERQCADETICRTDQYIGNPDDPIENRRCSPILECKSYEVETKSGGLTSETECTSMLQWSAAWVYVIVGTPLFGLVAYRSWRI